MWGTGFGAWWHIRRWSAALAAASAALLIADCGRSGRAEVAAPPRVAPPHDALRETFAQRAALAQTTLVHVLYRPPGRYAACVPDRCGRLRRDWGADSLTGALLLREQTVRDPSLRPILRDLARAVPTYGVCRRPTCREWSDIPLWDAVAAARLAAVLGDRRALEEARRAFAFVDDATSYARGACPAIDYQQPDGRSAGLKTLETDANRIRAALLLARLTRERRYIARARSVYAAVRALYFEPRYGLYTTYVFDDGRHCRALPQRFFASVNGLMILNGLALTHATGDRNYASDARATAHAAMVELADPAGIFADLQADNDVVEPLVEAMLALAPSDRSARDWILANAEVARPGVGGAYGRFFDGPPPITTSAWATSGGLALAFAAAALDPSGQPATTKTWRTARYTARAIDEVPATIAFHGRAIALIGVLGALCCERGRIRVLVDGRELVDRSGIWQNKSAAGVPIPHTALFVWRWPATGPHTIRLLPAAFDPKEGGTFVRLTGYEIVP